MNLSIEWSGFLDEEANPVVYPYRAVVFPLVEVVVITTEKKYTFRFPAGYNISIDLKSMFYLYSISDNVYSSFPSTYIEFLYYRSDSPNPITAQPQPNERVTFDLTVQFPDPADFIYEPIELMEPFLPLFTSTGFAYYGTLVVLPNTTKTFSTEAIALRLPINRRTGIDLNAQSDDSGVYITPEGDSELFTTVIEEQAEINFIKENVQLRILNPTDIVHYYESTKTYIVSNIFEFRAPVKYITPYNTASLYENTQNILLPIPLTGGEFDVNLITKMVTERDTRLYTKPSLNTSIAIVTNLDGSVVPMLAETTSVYGYIPSVRNLFFVIGYDYFTPLEDVLQPDPELGIISQPDPELLLEEAPAPEIIPSFPIATTNNTTEPPPTPTQPNVSVGTGVAENYTPPTPDVPLPKELRINTVSDCIGIGEPTITHFVWEDYTEEIVKYQNCPPVTKYYDGYPFFGPKPGNNNFVAPVDPPEILSLQGPPPTPPPTEILIDRRDRPMPLPTERTNVDDKLLPDVLSNDVKEPNPVVDKPKSIVNEPWFAAVIAVIFLVVFLALIIGVLMYGKRLKKSKK